MSAMDVEIQIRPEHTLAREERAALDALDHAIFHDHPFVDHFTWTDPQWRVLVLHRGTVASHVQLFARIGRHADQPVTIAGVGAVMTRPEYRGRGLASLALDRTRQLIKDQLHADLGLLFCVAEIVPFYEQRGWVVVRSPVWIAQPHGTLQWPHTTMVLPRDQRRYADAPIDLCGYP